MMMRWLLALVLAPVLAGCASQGASSTAAPLRSIALHNSGFEADPGKNYRCPPRWSCTVHNNPDAFRFTVDETTAAAGNRSLKVEPGQHKEPWALVMQVLHDDVAGLRGSRVRLSFAVRLEGFEGKGVGPMALAQYSHGATLGHWQTQASGTADWKRLEVEFVVPKEAALLEVGAIIEGAGRVWIDAARLDVLESGAAGKNPV